MTIHKFKEFSDELRIVESLSEFGFNHTGATGLAGGGISGDATQPNDPSLTTDGWDRHKNNIANSQNRLSDVLKSIFNNNPTQFIGSKEVELKLEKLKINRMYRNPGGGVDIYLEYVFEHNPDAIHYGIFKNWGSNVKPKFVSRLTEKNTDKMSNIKIVGLMKHALEKWFQPKKGEYLLLNEEVGVWDELGTKYMLKRGDKVVIDQIQLASSKPVMHIVREHQRYKLRDLDFWYFNWWFEPVKKANLKI